MSNPRTWEEAAQAAAELLYGQDGAASSHSGLGLDMEDLAAGQSWSANDWGMVGKRALYASPRKTTAHYALENVVQTVISKQHDYGHGNILAYGIQGVCVRLSDKWARIQNLEKKGVDAQNESLLDSYLDLVGYCIIAIMLCEGTFELPLAEDLPKAETSESPNVAFVHNAGWAPWIKEEIAKAIDAHLAAFHPSTMPPNSGIYVGDVPPYNPNQGIFPWGWPHAETRTDTR